MFGSINVVSSKPSSDRKEKKAKKDKKSRKKEKKAKKDKRSRRRRSSSSDSDASSYSSRGGAPAAAPAESAEALMLKRKREDDAMWDSLLGGGGGGGGAPTPAQAKDEAGGGGGAGDVYQGKDWFKDRHAERLRKKPVDAADSLRAGLRGHFTRSGTQDSSANQSMLAAAASVEIPPSTLMRELVDAEGRWEGVFVPPHHRDETTLEAWRALLDRMKDQGDAKRRRLDKPDKAAATPSAASGGGYEGTSMAQLLAESRAERFGGGKDRKERSLRETMGNGCQISYGSERFSKESVISMGERTMLTLPVYSALCEGQCYITTIERRLCELDFEEDEQVEVRNFKKCLIAKAAAQGKQMVFSEFSNPSARRQTYIDCVPVDNEDWDDIEMFFYKALLESEDEFIQQHKPVISTKGKLLKQCLAPNIPYYHVSFGLDGGYAHVVADPKRFPRYLTNDILGPIIGAGLDGRLSAAQRERLLGADARKAFRAAWDTYDWTKMLDQQEVVSEDEGSRRGDDDDDDVTAQPPTSAGQ